MDWWTGYETLTWLAEAHENVGVLPLSQAETVSEISTYLGGSLSVVVSELKDICANCEVGITSRKEDMTFLGLEDFVCSDFDSVEGSAFYPERNCSEVDVQWAEAPTSLSAPCCSNQTLVKASVEMMTEALIYGIDFLPLTTLLNGGSDPSYDSVNYFVQYHVVSDAFVMQLIVSRNQRMAATEFHVKPIQDDAPDRVEFLPSYWSFNYANVPTQRVLLAFMIIFGIITFNHDRRQVWADWSYVPRHSRSWQLALGRNSARATVVCCRPLEKCAQAARAFVADCRHAVRLNAHTLTGLEPYVFLIELPAVVLPFALEIIRPFIELPTWSFWVIFTEMVLSMRLLHEGTVVGPLKRLVRVVDEAAPNMFALVVVLMPISMLTSLMHSQLFGLFDEGFADFKVALSRVINMLTAPPPQENTEGANIQAQQSGAELLFYWSTVVIRLCFGSFIVAILVGAFNKVVQQEESERTHRTRDRSLPVGYRDVGRQRGHICQQLGVFARYFLVASIHGKPATSLLRELEEAVAVAEHGDDSGAVHLEQIMIGHDELVVYVGRESTKLLLHAYGARRLHYEEALDA